MIGLDEKSRLLYGLDQHMGYLNSKDEGRTWKFISPGEWKNRQEKTKIAFATKLNDILVGSSPSLNWTSPIGYSWGGELCYFIY